MHFLCGHIKRVKKIYEAVRCHTPDGSLVSQMTDVVKVYETNAMKIVSHLESTVLAELEKQVNIKFKKCGLFLSHEQPVIGATPDAVSDDFIVEIKCPTTDKTFTNYIKDSNIAEKYYAQMQTQIYMLSKSKELFCVADAKFESNKKITVTSVDYNAKYTEELFRKANLFWKTYVFPVLVNSLQY